MATPQSQFSVSMGRPPGWPRNPDAAVRERAVQALLTNHTLIVGQSRSGKTTVARRLIEEILLWTDTRIVLLDPNADFRLLNRVNPKQIDRRGDDREFPKQWRRIEPLIRIASQRGRAPWGILWGQLSFGEMAAFLKLTPKDDFPEYQHLVRHYEFEKKTIRRLTLDQFKQSKYFKIAAGEALERYRLLLEDLTDKEIWAEKDRTDLDSLLSEDYRAAVLDLAVKDDEVRAMMVARALQVLWQNGEATRTRALQSMRRPQTPWVGTLVVIDEAHVFAPPEPTNPQQRLVSEKIQRFAEQGKKFNLHLMLITQQPDKLNPRILAECGNRIILRMNERLSLESLEKTYGGPDGRYDGTLTFSPGEALIEGAMLCDEDPPSPVPRGILFRQGRTREGGGTPRGDWALPRSV